MPIKNHKSKNNKLNVNHKIIKYIFLASMTIVMLLIAYLLNRQPKVKTVNAGNKLDNFTYTPNHTCSDFEVKYGNPERAKLIFISESHDDHDSSKRCIEELTSTNVIHRLLLEYPSQHREISCLDRRFSDKKGSKCFGWDTREGLDNSCNYIWEKMQVELLLNLDNLLLNLTTQDKLIPSAEEYADQMTRDMYKNFSARLHNEFDSELNIEKLRNKQEHELKQHEGNYLTLFSAMDFNKSILLLRKKGYSYIDIIDNKLEIVSNFHLKEERCVNGILESMRIRNQCMLFAIRKHTKNRLVIVITGAAHVLDVDNLSTSVIEETRKELNKDDQTTPYAILQKKF